MANEAKLAFGTEATVLTGVTAALTNGAVSTSGTATVVELDNSTSLYPLAIATLTCNWTVAPTAGSTVDLYMYKAEVDGASVDEPTPTAADLEGAHYLGSFVPSDATGAQSRQIQVSLDAAKKMNFAVENNSGQSMPTGWTVKVTPFTYAPAA